MYSVDWWDQLAQRIGSRKHESYLATDYDNPYWDLVRKKLLTKFLDVIDFNSKVALEVGCGPGGNLLHIAQHHSPKMLIGVDVSVKMLELARNNLARHSAVAELCRIDGITLPIADRSVDVSFTVTVLQHVTDAGACSSLIREMCRVTRKTIIIIEHTASEGLGGSEPNIGRRVDVYKSVFGKYGFEQAGRRHLNTRLSRIWYHHVTGTFESRKATRGVSRLLGASLFPITRILDDLLSEADGVTEMTFHRATPNTP
jgi:ubiquinone/menaquinone biosynthesis C-methylase UbiE